MIISITDVARETAVVTFGLLFALIISAHGTKRKSLFPIEVTNELKGVAILMIVLSHIGYFLVSDRHFLVPLSNYAGVGVDLFLVLSGYGLTASALRRPLSIGKFYLKRLPRVYLPVIITLGIFLLLDGIFLNQTYPVKTIFLNLLGIFPRADLYLDIDSPMWFITFLMINYLLFPAIFHRRWPAISAMAMALVIWPLVFIIPEINLLSPNLDQFYKLHFLSFPLGMLLAAWINQPSSSLSTILNKIHALLKRHRLTQILRLTGIILAGATLYYNYYHSQIGASWQREAIASLFAVVAILIIFILKKIDFTALYILGLYSFEIYLLHWPLLWRYNFLFGRLPAGIATLIYLGLFTGIGYLFNTMIGRILGRVKSRSSSTY